MQNQTTALVESSGGAMQQAADLAMPIPTAAIRARHLALGEIMHSVMQKGTDYDEIPGTNKPTLLKAGAETLMACFSLHPEITTSEHFDPNIEQIVEAWETKWSGPQGKRVKTREQKTYQKRGFYEVVARCTLRAPGGAVLGTLSGSCNSLEQKYITQSLHDVKNTILKMAEKRAIVAAVLAVTGASRVFTQDMEDMREQLAREQEEKGQPAPPKEKGGTRKDPSPESVFAYNKKQIEKKREEGVDALRSLKLDGGKWMSDAQIAELREMKKAAIAELEASESSDQAEPEEKATTAASGKEKSPIDPKIIEAKADALYQRLAQQNKDSADELWVMGGTMQEIVDRLHSALMDRDPAYRAKHADRPSAKRLHQEDSVEGL